MPNEEWKLIRGFDGHYSVSNMGRIRSEERRVVNSQTGGTRRVRSRILKLKPDGSGYLFAALRKNSKEVAVKVASAVAMEFIGSRPLGFVVCHNDGTRTNNRASNLRYDTRSGNMADCIKHGTRVRGERHASAKLTEAEVRRIQRDTRTLKEIAREVGVSLGQVSAIKRGESWSHLTR